jgi:hypothetical protein
MWEKEQIIKQSRIVLTIFLTFKNSFFQARFILWEMRLSQIWVDFLGLILHLEIVKIQ